MLLLPSFPYSRQQCHASPDCNDLIATSDLILSVVGVFNNRVKYIRSNVQSEQHACITYQHKCSQVKWTDHSNDPIATT